MAETADTSVDSVAWDRIIGQHQIVLDSMRVYDEVMKQCEQDFMYEEHATTASLDSFRAEMVYWRDRFSKDMAHLSEFMTRHPTKQSQAQAAFDTSISELEKMKDAMPHYAKLTCLRDVYLRMFGEETTIHSVVHSMNQPGSTWYPSMTIDDDEQNQWILIYLIDCIRRNDREALSAFFNTAIDLTKSDYPDPNEGSTIIIEHSRLPWVPSTRDYNHYKSIVRSRLQVDLPEQSLFSTPTSTQHQPPLPEWYFHSFSSLCGRSGRIRVRPFDVIAVFLPALIKLCIFMNTSTSNAAVGYLYSIAANTSVVSCLHPSILGKNTDPTVWRFIYEVCFGQHYAKFQTDEWAMYHVVLMSELLYERPSLREKDAAAYSSLPSTILSRMYYKTSPQTPGEPFVWARLCNIETYISRLICRTFARFVRLKYMGDRSGNLEFDEQETKCIEHGLDYIKRFIDSLLSIKESWSSGYTTQLYISELTMALQEFQHLPQITRFSLLEFLPCELVSGIRRRIILDDQLAQLAQTQPPSCETTMVAEADEAGICDVDVDEADGAPAES